MKLFQRIFVAAVLAGLAAGLLMSAIQQWRVVPLILAAEAYETADAPAAHTHEHTEATAHTHEHDAQAWAPQDGAQRTGFTVLADVLASMGFALLLVALSVLVRIDITVQNGVLWGLGGWLSLHLAPAFGLPPELPGMPAADLVARQLWWFGTALATGGALLLVAKLRSPVAIGVAAVLILVPHLIGAPAAPEAESTVPAHLATAFAASALTASALFWLLVGPLIGYFAQRLARAEHPTLAKAIA